MPSTEPTAGADRPAPPTAGRAPFAERLEQAVGLLRDEQLDAAEQAFAALLAERPEQPDCLHYAGILRHVQGRSDEGLAMIRRGLAAQPGAPGPWNNLGNVLLECGRADEAALAYEHSLAVAPDDVAGADALDNLGVLYRSLGRPEDAERCLRRAVAARPDFGLAWFHLSQLLVEGGRVHEGLIANSRAITLLPLHSVGREQVIRALLLLEERERAAALYRQWLAEEPDNPVVRHQLAACLGEDAPPRASDAYVQQVFDSFAASFDSKLERLHYRAPQLVADALQGAAGAPAAALGVVDLGCGTGLCGPLLRPHAQRLAGCDLSVGMLRKARARKVYDALHKAELVHYLDTQPGAFDAAVSADTLCYFGALEKVFEAAQRALRPGGWLVFTLEALDDDAGPGHRLQPNGRYAHARAYAQHALRQAGLEPRAVAAEVLREEAGRPVDGWLVSARRP